MHRSIIFAWVFSFIATPFTVDYFLPESNITFMAAPAPMNVKINNSQGDVPSLSSKNLPKSTPIRTHAAIVTPIWEKTDNARRNSFWFDFLLLF